MVGGFCAGELPSGKLAGYHLLPAVRGDFLSRLGRHREARAEFERAAGMTRNERERALLDDFARSVAGRSLARGM